MTDQLGHLVERLSRWLDDHIDAGVEFGKLGVGDDAGDLHQRVVDKIKPCHLAVNPDQSVSHLSSLGQIDLAGACGAKLP